MIRVTDIANNSVIVNTTTITYIQETVVVYGASATNTIRFNNDRSIQVKETMEELYALIKEENGRQ
jgi:hypothetical protein